MLSLYSDGTFTAWGKSTETLLGITVIEYIAEVGYTVKNGKITTVNFDRVYISRNLNPLYQSELIDHDANIINDGDKVEQTSIWTYILGPINDIGIQLGTFYTYLTATVDGQSFFISYSK